MNGLAFTIIVLISMVISHDFTRFKQARISDRLVYIALLSIVLLLSADCIWHTKLFPLYDWVDFVLGPSSRKVIQFLTVPD
ncbi:hypothetical protein D3C85_1402760 [compost metagenome]